MKKRIEPTEPTEPVESEVKPVEPAHTTVQRVVEKFSAVDQDAEVCLVTDLRLGRISIGYIDTTQDPESQSPIISVISLLDFYVSPVIEKEE